MRLKWQSFPLLIFLIPSLPTILARSIPSESISDVVARADTDTSTVRSAPEILGDKLVGTHDAPVDGKDGRPHAGPWVETEASRDRKKAKEAGEEEVPLKPIDKELKNKLESMSDGEKAPESNDGVMDDPHRVAPKEGTRGTEGGVSERTRESSKEKKVDAPKEIPPLPHSEQEKISKHEKVDGSSEEEDERKEEHQIAGLEKPDDLPEKPHDIPIPNPQSVGSDHLDIANDATHSLSYASALSPDDEHVPQIIQPLHSFLLSCTMILFSEIGDKTFLVAALMAMRHPRMVVFTAAFGALIAMTILSAVLGHAVPTLIPKTFTNFLASALFFVFGAKLFREARGMSPHEGVGEEMKEVEMELEEKEHQQRRMSRRRSSISPYVLESGRAPRKSRSSTNRLPSPPESPSSSSSREPSPPRTSTLSNIVVGVNNLFSLLLSPAWVQTFVMTFLGEWGDRSQIATIAMAAGQDYWWVSGGAMLGHSICTGVAVLGGRAIAGRVSMRVVTFGGAIAFLIFGLIYLFEAIY